MTTPVSAHSAIAAIWQREGNPSGQRLHTLLFFCQGHYLAGTGAPLFAEPIYATSDGVTVDLDGPAGPPQPLNNRQLGFIGYALDRYGHMRDVDAQTLVEAFRTWRDGTYGDSGRVEWAHLHEWFRRPAERANKPSPEEAGDYVARLKARTGN